MHAKPGKIIITLLLFLVACSLLLAAFVNYAGYTRRSREEDAFRELEQSAAVGAQMMDTSLREMRGVTDTLATTLSRLEFADTDDMRGYLSRCALDNGLAWLIYQESGGDPVSSDGAVHDLPEEVTQWASGISSPYVDGAAGNAVVTFYQTVQQDGEALVSTVLFDNVSEVIHDRVNIRDIQPMTDKDYTVRGCTALLDAIGGAIHHIGNIHKYARPEDVPEHTLFIITTDGMENASRFYSSDRVKQMIQRQKTKYGWEFLFLGANIDAVETARHFGIGADRAVNYNSDSAGTQLNYEVLNDAISAVRSSAPLGADWKSRIDEDYEKRGKGEKR